MQESVSFKHDFFVQAGTAFVGYLDRLLKVPMKTAIPTIKEFPIFIKNTGDEVFLSNMQESSSKKDVSTLYTFVPRMSLEVQGINMQSGQLTNPHELGAFSATAANSEFKSNFVANVRRIPIEWTFNSELVFNNVLEYLAFIEIFLTVSHLNHYFTFYHAGTEYSGTFFLQEDLDTSVNLSLQFDADKRTRKMPLVFTLQLQFPAFNIYSRDSWNKYQGQVLNSNDTMQHLIHNMHVNDTSAEGIVSTIGVPDMPPNQE